MATFQKVYRSRHAEYVVGKKRINKRRADQRNGPTVHTPILAVRKKKGGKGNIDGATMRDDGEGNACSLERERVQGSERQRKTSSQDQKITVYPHTGTGESARSQHNGRDDLNRANNRPIITRKTNISP